MLDPVVDRRAELDELMLVRRIRTNSLLYLALALGWLVEEWWLADHSDG